MSGVNGGAAASLMHGHADVAAEVFKCCWKWRRSSSSRISQSLCRRSSDSNRRVSFSEATIWVYCKADRSRFISSRFPNLSRAARFLRFSKCLCFRMRDRRADSRLDCIRRSFLSSMTEPEVSVLELLGRSGSLKLVASWFDSSEPEFVVVTN